MKFRIRSRAWIAALSSAAMVAFGLGAVEPVVAAPNSQSAVVVTQPKISIAIGSPLNLEGLACPDNTLRSSAEDPSWWHELPETFSYQWLRDGMEIAGETKGEYLVSRSDVGTTLKLLTTAHKQGRTPTPVEHYEQEVLECPTPPPAAIPLLGPATVGTVLAVGGSWNPDVTIYYFWMRDGIAIGINSATYRLTPADLGKKISASLSYRKPGHLLAGADSSTVVVGRGKLASSSAPKIQGKLQAGERLSVTHGKYTATPQGYQFRWYRNGKPIPGAVTRHYRLTGDDVPARLSVKVTASAHGYLPLSTTTSPTAKIAGGRLLATKKPGISGSPRYGGTLKVSRGTWNVPPTGYSYQWYSNGKAIRGATKTTYKPPKTVIGKKVNAKVTVKRTGFTTGVSFAAQKRVSTALFKKVGKPSISGTPKAGRTLTARPGATVPKATSHSYQWYKDGKAIKGATKSRHKVAGSDFGRKFHVKVTAKRAYYSQASASSSAKYIAKGKFTKVMAPKITGTAKVGKTLTAKPGVSSPRASSYSYQWYRGSKAIKNATKKTYKLVAADSKRNVYVRVTAKKTRYSNVSKNSSKTYVRPKPAPAPEWDNYSWLYEEDDYWSDDTYNSGKAPNRCYAPGGKTYTYC